MNAEIISVGTELLLGEIPNSNAQFISERLAAVGVDVLFHSTVGDNLDRLSATIEHALGRSDVVILTGGLGPTHDDLTREAIARATARELVQNPDVEEDLREWFSQLEREMPQNQLRQARFPAGAQPIPNLMGTAPGIELEHEGKLLYAVPGVPSEMIEMVQDHLVPRLAGAAGERALVVRNLKITGIPEAEVAERIEDTVKLLEGPVSPKIAIYGSVAEVRIRISKKAQSTHAAYIDIFQVEGRLRRALGDAVFGADADTLESVVGDMAKEKGLSVAIAESFTGGSLISRLISVPDASEFVVAGYVTYAVEAKVRDLDLDPTVVEEFGAVSAETAIAMAEGVRRRSGADIGLSTTGEAGPEPLEQPVGTMYLGLSWKGGSLSHRDFGIGDREAIRKWGSQAALNLLRLWMIEGRQAGPSLAD